MGDEHKKDDERTKDEPDRHALEWERRVRLLMAAGVGQWDAEERVTAMMARRIA